MSIVVAGSHDYTQIPILLEEWTHKKGNPRDSHLQAHTHSIEWDIRNCNYS
jgi:hypothetical protein